MSTTRTQPVSAVEYGSATRGPHADSTSISCGLQTPDLNWKNFTRELKILENEHAEMNKLLWF